MANDTQDGHSASINVTRVLTEAGIHWAKLNEDHLEVHTTGDKTQDCKDIQLFLQKCGLHLTEQSYVAVLNLTISTYHDRSF